MAISFFFFKGLTKISRFVVNQHPTKEKSRKGKLPGCALGGWGLESNPSIQTVIQIFVFSLPFPLEIFPKEELFPGSATAAVLAFSAVQSQVTSCPVSRTWLTSFVCCIPCLLTHYLCLYAFTVFFLVVTLMKYGEKVKYMSSICVKAEVQTFELV